MEKWTEASTAFLVGRLVHKNNWHAIKADPRFGPWLVDFSADDLRDKVKAYEDEDKIGTIQQTGVNQEGMNIWQKIKADPRFGPVLSGRSEDDLRNKFMAVLESFGVTPSDFVDGPVGGAVSRGGISREEILGELNAITERLMVSRKGILVEEVSRQDLSAQLSTITVMVLDLIKKVDSV